MMFLLYQKLEDFHQKKHPVRELSGMIWEGTLLGSGGEPARRIEEYRLSKCVPILHWFVVWCLFHVAPSTPK